MTKFFEKVSVAESERGLEFYTCAYAWATDKMQKLVYEIKILIKAVSNHLRAKFGVIRHFTRKNFVGSFAENLNPMLKMF
ncbi:MAG: hypothetical protein H0X72_10310 [Acidobacteria bacterium]|jgi:hypothetical protein|nr:hypothetical protein [Acidobacteriota bacterium]